MSDAKNTPNWLTPSSNDDKETPEAKELVDLGVKGLIAIKRLFMSPANTKNETDAAGEIVEVIRKIRELVDVGPKR